MPLTKEEWINEAKRREIPKEVARAKFIELKNSGYFTQQQQEPTPQETTPQGEGVPFESGASMIVDNEPSLSRVGSGMSEATDMAMNILEEDLIAPAKEGAISLGQAAWAMTSALPETIESAFRALYNPDFMTKDSKPYSKRREDILKNEESWTSGWAYDPSSEIAQDLVKGAGSVFEEVITAPGKVVEHSIKMNNKGLYEDLPLDEQLLIKENITDAAAKNVGDLISLGAEAATFVAPLKLRGKTTPKPRGLDDPVKLIDEKYKPNIGLTELGKKKLEQQGYRLDRPADGLVPRVVETTYHNGEWNSKVLPRSEVVARQKLAEGQDWYIEKKRKRAAKEAANEKTRVGRMKNRARKAGKGFMTFIDSPVTAMTKALPPQFALSLRQMEHTIHEMKGAGEKNTMHLQKVVKKLDAQERELLNRAYLDQDAATVKLLMEKAEPGFYDNVFRPSIMKRQEALLKTGSKFNIIDEVLPRYVTDYDAIREYIYRVPKSQLKEKPDLIIKKLNNIDKKVANQTLTELEGLREYNKVFTKSVRRKTPTPVSTHEKKRYFEQVPEELRGAYAGIEDSYRHFMMETAQTIGEKTYLGYGDIPLPDAITRFVEKARKNGSLNHAQISALQRILEARFSREAKSSMSKGMQDLRDVGMMTTIGNAMSTLIQGADAFTAPFRYGPRAGFTGMAKAMVPRSKRKGRNVLDPLDLGIYDMMLEMSGNPRLTKVMLDKIFDITGFKMLDRFGKRVHLNAALAKYSRLAQKGKTAKLEKDYGPIIPKKEWPEFLEALRNKDLNSPHVRFVAFNELANVQPILLSDMPIWYLTHPNGRLLYSLKTWSLRVINTMREDWLKGDKGQAAAYGAGVALSSGSFDMARDIIKGVFSGKEVKPEDVPAEFTLNLLSIFLINKYGLQQLGKGRGAEWAAMQIMPPGIQLIFDIAGDAAKAVSGGVEDMDDLVIDNKLPVVGPFLPR